MNRFLMALACVVFFLAGYLASTLLTPKQVQAQAQGDRVYKVVHLDDRPISPEFAARLILEAKGGWRIVPLLIGGGDLMFEK